MNCEVCKIPIQEFPEEYTDRMGSQISPKYYRMVNGKPIFFCSPHCGTEWIKNEEQK